jgi:hypothetical protein
MRGTIKEAITKVIKESKKDENKNLLNIQPPTVERNSHRGKLFNATYRMIKAEADKVSPDTTKIGDRSYETMKSREVKLFDVNEKGKSYHLTPYDTSKETRKEAYLNLVSEVKWDDFSNQERDTPTQGLHLAQATMAAGFVNEKYRQLKEQQEILAGATKEEVGALLMTEAGAPMDAMIEVIAARYHRTRIENTTKRAHSDKVSMVVLDSGCTGLSCLQESDDPNLTYCPYGKRSGKSGNITLMTAEKGKIMVPDMYGVIVGSVPTQIYDEELNILIEGPRAIMSIGMGITDPRISNLIAENRITRNLDGTATNHTLDKGELLITLNVNSPHEKLIPVIYNLPDEHRIDFRPLTMAQKEDYIKQHPLDDADWMSGVKQLPTIHNVHKSEVTTSSMTPEQRYAEFAEEMKKSGHWTEHAEAMAKSELAAQLKVEAKSTSQSVSESEGGSPSLGTLEQEEKREEYEDEKDSEYEPPHKITKLSQTETTDEEERWILLDYYDTPIHISKTITSDSFYNFMHDQERNTDEKNITIQLILKERSKGTTDLERGNIINFFFTTVVALEKKEEHTAMSGTIRQITSGIDSELGTICNESNSEDKSKLTIVYDRYDVGGQLQHDRAGSSFYMHNMRSKSTDC